MSVYWDVLVTGKEQGPILRLPLGRCNLFVSLDYVHVQVGGGWVVPVRFAVPLNASLIGVEFFQQWVVVGGVGSVPRRISSSNGGHGVIGT